MSNRIPNEHEPDYGPNFKAICVGCGCPTAGGQNVEDRTDATAPKPGDAAICCECLTVNMINEDGSFRPPTPEEQEEIDTSPRLRAAIAKARSEADVRQEAYARSVRRFSRYN